MEDRLKTFISYEGWILGDAHPQNFSAQPFENEWFFVADDFDDGGEGPLILDLLRFLAVVKDHNSSMRDQLIESYKKGLCEGPPKVPDFMSLAVQSAIPLSKDVDLSTERFRRGKRELFPLPKRLREELSTHLPSGQILDSAVTHRERGGSAYLQRYWILIKTQDGQLKHFEFKSISDPAINMYKEQTRTKERIGLLKQHYWPEPLRSSLQVVEIQGKEYLLRERFANPLKKNHSKKIWIFNTA